MAFCRWATFGSRRESIQHLLQATHQHRPAFICKSGTGALLRAAIYSTPLEPCLALHSSAAAHVPRARCLWAAVAQLDADLFKRF